MNQDSAFVVVQHTTPQGVHWDLMLQINEVLWTWRMGCLPADIGNSPVEAEKIADHSLRFLTYEGPVQDNTGSVKIIDSGRLLCLETHENKCYFTCRGSVISGSYVLHHQQQNQWLLKLCK